MTTATREPLDAPPIQQRHTIAAIVYFLYGIIYLAGAQYLTSTQMTGRGMANPRLFFFLGGIITILFPLLIYGRLALALSWWWKPRAERKTLFIDFTLILGILVAARVVALLRGELYARTWLHTAGLIVASVNAACLLWAGLGRPAWIRESRGP